MLASGPGAAHRISIIVAAISAAMMTMWVGLLIMCRSMAKRVPSGSRAMPQ
jgi:hypothetical protein